MDEERQALVAELVKNAIPAWAIAVVRLNKAVADRLGVAESDVQCLHVLDRLGPATPGALAKQVGLTTGSASRMIDRLVAAGCVRRVADPGDRRRVLIEPTPDGIARVSAAYAGLITRTEQSLAPFDDRALEAILEFVRSAHRDTTAELHHLPTPTTD
ncbi:MarR family transcriptional regulator [Nonomuraea sp. NPDC049725]|uniref:MarR family winged helix-turn-helix transcriptional regulator n=1 Tax=Nonomuraea sp. NPDC049725 TaxID=3154508 RepID=UPI003445D12E